MSRWSVRSEQSSPYQAMDCWNW